MNKTLSVSAIEQGTVIDHIPAGQSTCMIHLLKLTNQKNQVTIGVNLKSKLGFKDLIKMENRHISEREAHEIAIFAPEATVNIIEDFKVVKKYRVMMPEKIVGIFVCPNPTCISNHEPIPSVFMLNAKHQHVKLHCKYCEKSFEREDIKDYAS